MNLNDFQRAAGITQQRAQQWLEPLNAAMAEFYINTPLRQAGFIAQLGMRAFGLPGSSKASTTVMLRVWR